MCLVQGTGICITYGVLISHISVERILHHHSYSTYLFAIASSEILGKWVQVLGRQAVRSYDWSMVFKGTINQSYLKLANPNEPSNHCVESLYPFYLKFSGVGNSLIVTLETTSRQSLANKRLYSLSWLPNIYNNENFLSQSTIFDILNSFLAPRLGGIKQKKIILRLSNE